MAEYKRAPSRAATSETSEPVQRAAEAVPASPGAHHPLLWLAGPAVQLSPRPDAGAGKNSPPPDTGGSNPPPPDAGNGSTLPFQPDMERVFGENFQGVNVRYGSTSGPTASAATEGQQITFAAPNPDRRLVAHELTHVVQNRRFGPAATGTAGFDSPAEHEAMAVAEQAASGRRVAVQSAPGGARQLARLPDDIRQDYLAAQGDGDLVDLFDLLKEAKQGHNAATRWIFWSNAAYAQGYSDLCTAIAGSIRQNTDAFVQTNRKVIINGHRMAGNGDLVLARKVAETLEAAGHNILIVSNAVEEQKKMAPAYDDRIQSSAAAVPGPFRKPAAFVHVGGVAGSKATYTTLGISPATPLIKLLEYGFGAQAAERSDEEDFKTAFGLAPGEAGIFIDPDLQARAAKVQSEDPAAAKDARVSELRAIGDGAVKRILFGKDAPSADEVGDYLADTNLYFGYAHSRTYVNHFINLVLSYEKEIQKGSKQHIDIFTHFRFPTGDKVMIDMSPDDLAKDKKEYESLVAKEQGQGEKALRLKYTLAYREKLMKSHMAHLAAIDVGEIQVVTRSSQDDYTLSGGTKKLRLIDYFGLTPADYSRLLIASGDVTMATGDQSFGQAIAANKMVFYEIYKHKVPLFQSWLAIAKKLFPNGPLVKFLETYTVAVSATGDPKDKEIRTAKELRGMIRDTKLRDEFTAFNQLVAAENSATDGIVSAVAQAFSGNRELLEREALIENVTSKKIGDFQRFKDRLIGAVR